MTNHKQARLSVVVSLAVLTLAGGCKLFGRDELVGPISYSRQTAEIRKIVAIGDPQQDVVKALEQAGIEGEYTRYGNSVYYCQIWDRPDGERWQMSVSLQFQNGVLSAIALYDSAWTADRLPDDDPSADSPAQTPARTTGFPRTGPPDSRSHPARTDRPFP
ncbi:MAG: hypothetical protein ACE5KM_17650, partial [Planctomycetaceae bacterium]